MLSQVYGVTILTCMFHINLYTCYDQYMHIMVFCKPLLIYMNTSRVIMDAYMLSYVYKWGYNKITILTKLTIKLIAPVDCFHPCHMLSNYMFRTDKL